MSPSVGRSTELHTRQKLSMFSPANVVFGMSCLSASEEEGVRPFSVKQVGEILSFHICHRLLSVQSHLSRPWSCEPPPPISVSRNFPSSVSRGTSEARPPLGLAWTASV
jgi:hypothetical protein